MKENYILGKELQNIHYAENAIMYRDFERCTFTGCNFTQCNFTGTAFIDCVFIDCDFNAARINYVSLRDVEFKGCDFSDVNFAMCDTLLFRFSFDNCVLDYAKFYTLKMRNMLFSNCTIVAADFMKADITGVIFDNCNLHQSVFADTIADKADFSTSYNFTIDPEKNKLKKAVFSQAGLKGLLTRHDLIIK